MKKTNPKYVISSVNRAFELLEQYKGDISELGITELSTKMRLSKNNVFRLLATLETHNYIEQTRNSDKYRLGYMNLNLGQSASKHMRLYHQSLPVLKSIKCDCNETSYVAVMNGLNAVCIDTVESTLPVRFVYRVGASLPIYCTAVGKVLLAGAIEKNLWNFTNISELQKFTTKTITDRSEYKKHLEIVLLHGYAVEDEEFDLGVKSVAAPIRDFSKYVVGAVSISGPTSRFDEERIQGMLVPIVKKAAEEISVRIGFCPSS